MRWKEPAVLIIHVPVFSDSCLITVFSTKRGHELAE